MTLSAIQWPSAYAIDEAIRINEVDPNEFIGNSFAPVVPSQFHTIKYDEIWGATGMTKAHSLDSDPKIIEDVKVREVTFQPGYFKETSRIKESDILLLRQLGGTPQQKMEIETLMQEKIRVLNMRMEARIEWLRWQAMITGKISIDEEDIKYEAAYGIPAENLNVPVPSAAWSDPTSSKPVEDIEEIVAEYFTDKGYEIQQSFMNSNTARAFCFSNDTKTYYNRALKLSEIPRPGNLEKYWSDFAPGKIRIYDKGYRSADYTFNKFLPDNKIVMLGKRPDNLPVLDVVTVPHYNPYTKTTQTGKFVIVDDQSGKKGNPCFDLIGGFYGLVRIKMPFLIVVVDVSQAE